MKTNLLFGKQELTLDLPDDISIYEVNKHPMPLIEDVDSAIRRSFQVGRSPRSGPEHC